MESSIMNNAFIKSKCETSTFSSDETTEESSWSMYLEDFCEAAHMGDFSSSSVPDAMSFVATKIKTLDDMSKQDEGPPNYPNYLYIKRTGNRESPFGRHCDLEDTASSPSRTPNVNSIINLLDSYTRHEGGVGEDTNNVKEKNAVQNQGGLSVDLKKKGLCLVPMSMVTNFLG